MLKIICLFIIIGLTGCQVSDEEIRADIASKARNDLNFTGLNYTVSNGVVEITGRCPSQEALNTIRQNLKNVRVIKAINYQVTIAPVILDTLTVQELRLDSLLSNYPQVIGDLGPDGIVLSGKILQKKHAELLELIRRNMDKKVKDNLIIY